MELCQQCHEKPATDTLPWYVTVPLLLVSGGLMSEKLCADCAGGKSFLGLGILVALVIAAFVVVVIIW